MQLSSSLWITGPAPHLLNDLQGCMEVSCGDGEDTRLCRLIQWEVLLDHCYGGHFQPCISCCFTEAWSWGQQPKRRHPDFPLCGQFIRVNWVDGIMDFYLPKLFEPFERSMVIFLMIPLRDLKSLRKYTWSLSEAMTFSSLSLAPCTPER